MQFLTLTKQVEDNKSNRNLFLKIKIKVILKAKRTREKEIRVPDGI